MIRKSVGKKIMVSAMSITAALLLLSQTQSFDAQALEHCKAQPSLDQSSAKCHLNATENLRWIDWFGGQSESYQFHFLDLLELLYSDDGSTNESFNSGTSSRF